MFNDDYPPRKRQNRSYYSTMQVCLGGDQITSFYDDSSNDKCDFCKKCGQKTIFRCQHCNEKIKGRYNAPGIIIRGSIPVPSNCHKCGKAYPWKSKSSQSKGVNLKNGKDYPRKSKSSQSKGVNLKNGKDYPRKSKSSQSKGVNLKNGKVLESIFTKFDEVVRQLRRRHKNRSTLNVKDEYDAQDLLKSLLKLYFDDIRPEEQNPSHAGSSTRSDFLLKNEKIIIEVKHTRKGLTKKKLKEELIIDKEQYKKNADCKIMYCFIYDPDKRINNPKGFVSDLSEKGTFTCKVIIAS